MNGWVPACGGWHVPTCVGATPLNSPPQAGPKPDAGAGVEATISIGKNKGLTKSLSDPERAAIWSTELAVNELAQGNTTAATGVLAGQILAVSAYYTVKALDQGFAQAAATSIQSALADVSHFVPVIGQAISTIATAISFIEAREQNFELAWLQHCGPTFSSVVTGNGGSNAVLPADLFMGPAKNLETGVFSKDAFGLNEPHNRANLTQLLVLLEEPGPDESGYKPPSIDGTPAQELGAKFAPSGGLTAQERSWLQQLRLGISAMYVNRGAVPELRIIDENTDGGTALFTLYLGILTRAWLEKRLNHGYLTWRLLAEGERYAANKSGVAFQFAKNYAMDPSSAWDKTRNYLQANFESGAPGGGPIGKATCPLYDYRTVDQLIDPNQGLVPGWLKTVAGQNWLAEQQGGKATWLPVLLLGGLAATGLYFFQPALAKSLLAGATAYGGRVATGARLGASAVGSAVSKAVSRVTG